ncbi:MAG: hypothetical protein Q9191_008469, partial [Dirinaria sp. TL-2023a]
MAGPSRAPDTPIEEPPIISQPAVKAEDPPAEETRADKLWYRRLAQAFGASALPEYLENIADGVTPKEMRPPSPLNFDGTATQLRPFIYSILVYVSLCPAQFTKPGGGISDKKLIIFALAYMKEGRARKWAANLHGKMFLSEGAPPPYLTNWEAFVGQLFRAFGDATLQITAQRAIDNIKQGSKSITEFIIDFEIHEDDTG